MFHLLHFQNATLKFALESNHLVCLVFMFIAPPSNLCSEIPETHNIQTEEQERVG